MNQNKIYLGMVGAAALALVVAASPVSASPLAMAASAAIAAAPAADLIVTVQAERRSGRRGSRQRERHSYPARPRDRGVYQDTVGSIVYDGVGYGYNRFTGQRYMSCMIDEGYGRVHPCDAGNGGGSSFN